MIQNSNHKKILVAMSGGVDSSVAAYLLKEAGFEVGGATIRTWASGDCAEKNTKSCCGVIGVEDARNAAWKLGIPHYVFNFEREFKTHVVDYFSSEYLNGRTPNPCIACNQHIKFGLFLKRARALGYDAIATGHYARVGRDESSGRCFIDEGEDDSKDQSYVLFPLEQKFCLSFTFRSAAVRNPKSAELRASWIWPWRTSRTRRKFVSSRRTITERFLSARENWGSAPARFGTGTETCWERTGGTFITRSASARV
jgi:tRNA-specific 2-thiouridylase